MHGRNNTTWETMLENDVWYVEHLSFSLDVKIFFLTIKNVLTSKDVVVELSGEYLDDERRRQKTK